MKMILKLILIFMIFCSSLWGQQYQNDIERLKNGSGDPLKNPQYVEKLYKIEKTYQDRVIWKTSSGTYLDKYICYGSSSDPIKFDIMIDADVKNLKNLKLTLSVYDVDESQGEVDIVTVNGRYVGTLHGANDSWSVNNYTLDPSFLNGGTTQNPGKNEIVVDLTVKDWCVTVDWGAISADAEDFKVVSFSPTDKQTNIDFKSPDIKAVFSDLPDMATISSTTFNVAYWDNNNNLITVNGTYALDTKTKTVTFTPSGDLLDGVKYRVEIKSGTNGVKSSAGAKMSSGKKWFFVTTPEIKIEKIDPIQTAEGANMISFKRGVVRVYATWEPKQNISLTGQADKIENVNITLTQPSFTIGTLNNVTIKRKDKYSAAEIRTAHNSQNFFNWFPPGFGSSLTAQADYKTGAGRSISVTKTVNYTSVNKEGAFSYIVRPVLVGSWKTAPASVTVATMNSICASSDDFMESIYPLHSVSRTTQDTLSLNQPSYSPMDEQTYLSWTLHDIRIKSSVRSNFIVAYVPKDYLGTGVLGYSFTIFSDVVAITESAFGTILVHEFSHNSSYLGMGHTDGPFGTNTPTIEGFRVDRGGLRGIPRSRTLNGVTSFMNTQPDNIGLAWITNSDYTSLLSSISKISINNNAMSVLIISGYMNSSDQITLNPVQKQDFSVVNPPNSGAYTIELLNSSNSVLSTNNFDPSQAVTGKDGKQYRLFSFVIPYNSSGSKIRIRKGTTVLKEVAASINIPVVAITSPISNSIISGTKTITWTASDADKDTLSFDVKISSDGGANWITLAQNLRSTSYTLRTNIFPSGNNYKIMISATDGFNTVTALVGVTISNGLTVKSVNPASNETGVPIQSSIKAELSSGVLNSDITSNNFTLSTGTTSIPGSVKYDANSRMIVFSPDKDLDYNTLYTAKLKAGIRDSFSNSLASDYIWTFRTETDTSLLEIVSTSPESLESSVLLNTTISVIFDKDVNGSTINSTTFKLQEKSSGVSVSGTYSYNSLTKTVVFTPTVNLKSETDYKVTLSNAITAANGKKLSNNYEYYFTTGTESITTGVKLAGKYSDLGIDDNNNGK